ncbi:hypothetical protein MASR1M42_23750 [Azonexus hydrophilus]
MRLSAALIGARPEAAGKADVVGWAGSALAGVCAAMGAGGGAEGKKEDVGAGEGVSQSSKWWRAVMDSAFLWGKQGAGICF